MKRHIARLTTGQRCLVVFMQLPDDPEHSLVVFTDNLPHKYESVLLPAAESAEGQQEETLANLLNRRPMIDGRHSILQALHEDGMLKRIQIDQIVMMPRPNMTFPLRQVLAQMGRLGNMQQFDMGQARGGYQAPSYAQPPAQVPPFPQNPMMGQQAPFQPPYPSSGNIPLTEAQRAVVPPDGYPKFDTKIVGEQSIGPTPDQYPTFVAREIGEPETVGSVPATAPPLPPVPPYQTQPGYPQGYPQQQAAYPQGYPQQGYPQQPGYPQGYPQPQAPAYQPQHPFNAPGFTPPPSSPFDMTRFNAQNHNRAVQAMNENATAALSRLRQAEMMESEAAKMRAEAARMAPSLFNQPVAGMNNPVAAAPVEAPVSIPLTEGVTELQSSTPSDQPDLFANVDENPASS